MSRTALFAGLRRAFALAAARRPGAPPLDELADPARAAVLPRRALLAGLGAAALPAGALAQAEARIAVVGAGLAGLVCAHRLVAAGARNVTLYEAGNRVGGRILSAPGLLGEGVVCELGGSFINTEHEDMLRLVREFGLTLEDGLAERTAFASYFVEGRHRTLSEIAAAAGELLPRLTALRAAPGETRDLEDRRSAAAMLDEFGVSGWLRRLLDVGLTQEMGLEPDRISALYLVETFAPDPDRPKLGLFSSDQRFQIAGGNDRLPKAIAARLGPGRIRLGHRMEAVRRRGQAYALTFRRDRAAVEVVADVVVLALPATVLRRATLEIGLPPLTERAIRELSYGTNAKLLAGVSARPWRAQGFSGEAIVDTGVQTLWEDHARPGTGPGGLTIFAGGRTGEGFARGTAEERVQEALGQLDPAFPGIAAAWNRKASRMAWPSIRTASGSYTCYAPGQWTGLAGAFAPAGRVVFAGEHTSDGRSGYMDGAAESGRIAAAAVARLIR